MRRATAACALLALGVACGGVGSLSARTPADGMQLYEATTTVLESAEHPPMLCLGAIATSFPPQCGDVPVANWSWDRVDGEERHAGTVWGEYHVVGAFDGEAFTVVDVGPPRERPATDEDPFPIPCPEPDGGWQVPDASRTSERHVERTVAAARRSPDFSGAWIAHLDDRATEDGAYSADIVLNVAFTGDLNEHERSLRGTWGGPLCVTQRERTYRDLDWIQNELSSSARERFGLQILWSAVSETRGVVEVGAVVVDPSTRAAVEDRYGRGIVEIEPALRPVP